jgi:hypothetical protein
MLATHTTGMGKLLREMHYSPNTGKAFPCFRIMWAAFLRPLNWVGLRVIS